MYINRHAESVATGAKYTEDESEREEREKGESQ
jgi:hypothetical protein